MKFITGHEYACLLARHDSFGVVRTLVAPVPRELAAFGERVIAKGKQWMVVKRAKASEVKS